MLQWEYSAILSTFIKLPFVSKIFVLSIFDLPLLSGFTIANIVNTGQTEADLGLYCLTRLVRKF